MSPDFAILIPAAGRSLRYSGVAGESKLAEQLGGRAVLHHSVSAFLIRADVAQVIIATQDEAGARALLDNLAADPRVSFAPGGASRAHSVQNALGGVRPDIPFVAVHDAARPLVSQALISRVFAAVRDHGAAGPATPVHLTIKQADGPLPAPIQRTIPRKTLWAMQTPQGMRTPDLVRAFAACPIGLEEVTDDLQLLELAGLTAMLVAGEEANLKITHPHDLHQADRFLRG